MSFETGKNLRIQVFGESHAAAIGVVLDGLPAGEAVDLAEVARLLQRRAPGKNALSTARREADVPEVVCGLLQGQTTGAPLTALIYNTDVRSADYASLQGQASQEQASLSSTLRVPRPGHSDYPAFVRYGGAADSRGGGAFSGRLTAPLCFAGGVALQLLARRGVHVYAHLASVGGICDAVPDFCSPDTAALEQVKNKDFPVLEDAVGQQMQQCIAAARQAGDSVGGSIRCLVTGLPAGLGAHMFDGVENRLAGMLFGIPGVKGVEFGSGFAGCEGYGSAQNDPFAWQDGRVVSTKNDAGGVLGGSTTGMPLVFRVGLKPTPSIAQTQQSVDLLAGIPAELQIKGRHDPCIVHRAVPVVEAAAALTLLDLMLDAPAVWPH